MLDAVLGLRAGCEQDTRAGCPTNFSHLKLRHPHNPSQERSAGAQAASRPAPLQAG